jgi:hypothetical protein
MTLRSRLVHTTTASSNVKRTEAGRSDLAAWRPYPVQYETLRGSPIAQDDHVAMFKGEQRQLDALLAPAVQRDQPAREAESDDEQESLGEAER